MRVAIALAALLAGGPAAAVTIEEVSFRSLTPISTEHYLSDAGSAPPVTVTGKLFLPAGDGAGAAVVLSHSAGGVSADRDLAWAELLARNGYVALSVDSFGPRGVRGVGTGQPALAASVADLFAGAALLRAHPRVDAARVVAMGLSRGGSAALYAALEPVRQAAGQPPFAAHVALYPYCATRAVAGAVTGAPVLMLLGEADDLTPPAACVAWRAWFAGKGAPARALQLPGARHLFDGTEPVRRIDAIAQRTCQAEYDLDLRLTRRLDTGAALTVETMPAYFRGCSERGFHLGGDPAARTAAHDEVLQLLARMPSSP